MKSAKADEIGSPLGQTDPEEKSSAEPREAYKRTLSGETTIENENSIKIEENRRFSTLTSFQIRKKQRKRHKSIPLPFFRFRLYREVEATWGQTDPEEKSSAEPREAYKRTLSGETAIENENPIKKEENRKVFNTNIF